MSRPDLNFIEDDLAGDNNSEHLTDLYDDDQDLFSDSRTNKKGNNDLITFFLTWYKITVIKFKTKISERWGTRHTFILLSFLGFANIYAMRVNLSVAIVAMVEVGKQTPNSGLLKYVLHEKLHLFIVTHLS